jgi:hypothetical protein
VVIDMPDDAPMTTEALDAETTRADAIAGIALTRDSTGATADISIDDHLTGKRLQRRISVQDPAVLAVRAVDLLRSSFLELPSGEKPQMDVVGVSAKPMPPEVRAFSAPQPKWQLQAAGAALWSRPFGFGYGGSVALHFQPNSNLDFGIEWAGPLIGARFSSTYGDAVIEQSLLVLRGSWNLLPAGVVRWGPTVGFGAFYLHAQGNVSPPLVATAGDTFSFACSAGAQLEVILSSALRLDASVDSLFLIPEPIVAVYLAQASSKLPLIKASLGLGVAF